MEHFINTKICLKLINQIIDMIEELQLPKANIKSQQYQKITEILFSILRALIRCKDEDQNEKMLSNNQNQILQRIMRNQYLLKHMTVKSVEEFEEKFVFNTDQAAEEVVSSQLLHKETIYLLSHLTIDNNVGITGAKRVLSFEYLRIILRKQSTPYYIKRVYLKFLFEVYLKHHQINSEDIIISMLIEILHQIVIKELKEFQFNIRGLVELQFKGVNLSKDHLPEKQSRTLSTCLLALEKIEKFTHEHLTGDHDIFDNQPQFAEAKEYDQRDQKKYWQFVLSGQHLDYSRYGLIDFIGDCFKEVTRNKWIKKNFRLRNSLQEVHKELNHMNQMILKMQNELSLKVKQNLVVIVNQTLNLYPSEDTKQFHRSDPDPLITESIKTEMERQKLTFDGLKKILKTDVDGQYEELECVVNYFHLFLGEKIGINEVENYILHINPSDLTRKHLNEFINIDFFLMQLEELVKYFEKEVVIDDDQEKDLLAEDFKQEDSQFITAEFQTYINDIKKLYSQIEIADIKPLATRLFFIVSMQFQSGNEEGIVMLLQGIQAVFLHSKAWIYMIMLLMRVLLHFQPVDSFNAQQMEVYQKLQCIYNDAGIPLMCLAKINVTNNKFAMNEIFELLNAILKFGNREVQFSILNSIKNSANQTSDLFRFLITQFADSVIPIRKNNSVSKLKMDENQVVEFSKESEIEEINLYVPEEKFIQNILTFIQFQCENCCLEFQEFFRQQQFPNRPDFTSLNLVGSIISFLTEITEYDSNDLLVIIISIQI